MSSLHRNKKEAESRFLKAIELKPTHRRSLSQLGKIYRLEKGDEEKALDYFMRAHASAINSGTPFGSGVAFNIGLLYYAKGDWEKADDYFNEAQSFARECIELFKNPYWEHFIIGVIRGLKCKLGEAKEFIDKAISLFKNSKWIRLDMKSELEFIRSNAQNAEDKEKIDKMISWLGDDLNAQDSL
jgi:tetratricopeptide (TPR) repeat protein